MKSKGSIPENDSFAHIPYDKQSNRHKFDSFGDSNCENAREDSRRGGSKRARQNEGSREQRETKAVEDSSVNIKEALAQNQVKN